MHSYAIAAVTASGAHWDRARTLRPVSLTPMQCRIYDFIRSYQQMWGDTPLYREIAHAAGLKTTSAVQHQIHRLAQLGVVRKPPRLRRAISLCAVPVKLT